MRCGLSIWHVPLLSKPYEAVHEHQNELLQDGYVLKVEGRRFAVPSGSMASIAAASPGLGLRAGMAVFVAGYKASFIDQDFTQYTLQAAAGKQLKEESTVCFLSPAVLTYKNQEDAPHIHKAIASRILTLAQHRPVFTSVPTM